jgi:hypothetical protein
VRLLLSFAGSRKLADSWHQEARQEPAPFSRQVASSFRESASLQPSKPTRTPGHEQGPLPTHACRVVLVTSPLQHPSHQEHRLTRTKQHRGSGAQHIGRAPFGNVGLGARVASRFRPASRGPVDLYTPRTKNFVLGLHKGTATHVELGVCVHAARQRLTERYGGVPAHCPVR